MMHSNSAKHDSPSELVKSYLLREINSNNIKPNDPIPSESELCKAFAASRFSVRKALSELAVVGTIYTIAGKGSFVAEPKEASVKKSQLQIGLLVPKNINDYFIGTIIMAIERRLTENGISVLLVCTNNDVSIEQDRLEQLASQNVAGFIVWPSDSPPGERKLQRYYSVAAPLVFLDRFLPEVPGDRVVGSDREGAIAAASHLIQHNRRHIGYFCSDIVPTMPSTDRLNGVLTALHHHGLSAEPTAFVDHVPDKVGYNHEMAERKAVRQYLEDNPILDAVITANDRMAAIFYGICEDMGIRIPDDLAIIGFSNSEFCMALRPELTSVDQSPVLLGTTAADIITRRVTSNQPSLDPEETIRLPYELIVRKSCGCQDSR